MPTKGPNCQWWHKYPFTLDQGCQTHLALWSKWVAWGWSMGWISFMSLPFLLTCLIQRTWHPYGLVWIQAPASATSNTAQDWPQWALHAACVPDTAHRASPMQHVSQWGIYNNPALDHEYSVCLQILHGLTFFSRWMYKQEHVTRCQLQTNFFNLFARNGIKRQIQFTDKLWGVFTPSLFQRLISFAYYVLLEAVFSSVNVVKCISL